jgi:hypothetical protein
VQDKKVSPTPSPDQVIVAGSPARKVEGTEVKATPPWATAWTAKAAAPRKRLFRSCIIDVYVVAARGGVRI